MIHPRDSLHTEFGAACGDIGTRLLAGACDRTLGPLETWSPVRRAAASACLSAGFPMWLGWGPQARTLYNDAFASLLGPQHPSALGKPFVDIFPEAHALFDGVVQALLREGKPWHWMQSRSPRITERRGFPELVYYASSMSPVYDGGKVMGIMCTVVETTREVVGERRLQALQDLSARAWNANSVAECCTRVCEALVHHTDDLPFVIVVPPSRHAKPRDLVRSTGLPETVSFDALVNGSDPPWAPGPQGPRSVRDVVQRVGAIPCGPLALAVQEARIIPLHSVDPDAQHGFVVIGLHPMVVRDNAYENFVGLVAANIGSAINASENRQKSAERMHALRELDRSKTAFFSNVSHELRTPLTLLISPLQEALAANPPSLSGRRLETAYRGAQRLLKLVNGLLDFTRLESGRVKASHRATDIAALTRGIVNSFAPTLERAGLALHADCPDLPTSVLVDPDMWEKIALNLLSNAFKNTLQGSIGVALHKVGDTLQFNVTDTGVGIPKEEQQRIFERFHTLKAENARSIEGTGIGLALVRELVLQHQGTITLESTVGVGTTFTVTLPFIPAASATQAVRQGPRGLGSLHEGFVLEAEQTARQAIPLPTASPVEPSGAAPIVLVVDDNAELRTYIADVMRGRWRVQLACDGAQALEIMDAQLPDVVLSDTMMPRMNGVELLRVLRADPRTHTIPILLMSAHVSEEARVQGLETGADDYLSKPFTVRELLARVEAHLKLSVLRRQAAQQAMAVQSATNDRRWTELVLDSAPTPTFLLQPGSGAVLFANRAARATLPEAWYTSADAEHPWKRAARGESFENVPAVWQGPQGSHAFLVNAAQLGEAHHHAPVGVITFQDVTALHQVEAELRAAVKARDTFLGLASHELRTPLTPLGLSIARLERAGCEPAVQSSLARIRQQYNALQSLVEELLDASRIDGGFAMERIPVDLREVVSAAIKTNNAIAQRPPGSVTFESRGDVRGMWDPHYLNRAVTHLVNNAVKFGRHQPIHVRLWRADDAVKLQVEDHGIGIAPQDVGRIFQRFERAVSEYNYRGLGLGLWIVNSIVNQLHGTIDVDSHLERGSTFTISLPVAP